MKKAVRRHKAKELIAETIIANSDCNLTELKIDFPYYDYAEEIHRHFADGKLDGLSKENMKRIGNDELFDLRFDIAFQPVYKDYFIHSLKHTTNRYLETKLMELGFDLNVVGEDEKTGLCPCCHYYSIDYGEDGLWDICPVCFWENGGNGPNHMSLEEAQQNFERYGAMSESSMKHVDPEGTLKYQNAHNTGYEDALNAFGKR